MYDKDIKKTSFGRNFDQWVTSQVSLKIFSFVMQILTKGLWVWIDIA